MQRPVALAGGAAILILLGVAVYGSWPRLSPAPAASIGGPFALIDEDSRAFSDRDLRGKPSAVFFGFTYCPEICPTTLASLTRWMKALGPDADRLNVVFVTVDPARDTPAALKAFLSPFDPRIRGLTGSDQAIVQAAQAYHVYYRKVPLGGGGYTMDHSSAIYLMDAQGRFVEPIVYDEPDDRALASLRRLVRR